LNTEDHAPCMQHGPIPPLFTQKWHAQGRSRVEPSIRGGNGPERVVDNAGNEAVVSEMVERERTIASETDERMRTYSTIASTLRREKEKERVTRVAGVRIIRRKKVREMKQKKHKSEGEGDEESDSDVK
jgi:nicotinamidase-related amidase